MPMTEPAARTLRERLGCYIRLTRLNKPIGILLLLWPTLWAVWIASNGQPSLLIVLVFVTGTVLMRSAGCAINDYADRDFDRHVARTSQRPVTSGRIAPWEAVMVAVVLSLVSLSLSLILTFNQLTLVLACVAAFLAGSYPFTKRFLAIPQAYLGVAFGFGIPMAFAAVLNELPPVTWILLAANIFWAIAYDTEYAMVDREDDLKIGIKTSAITFGRFDVLAVMLSYAMTLILLGFAGWVTGLGWVYATALLVAAGIAAYHYTLIRERERMNCFKAFLHNNWFGAAVFGGILLDYLLH